MVMFRLINYFQSLPPIFFREMLMSALNPVKESFYGKKKIIINVLTAFFISHKNDVKTFLKWILNQCPTALVNISLLLIGKFFYTKDWKNINSL